MITLKITLLLAIDLKSISRATVAKKKKGKKKKSKSTDSKKSKATSARSLKKIKSGKGSKKSDKPKIPEPEKDYVINVNDPLIALHVEYELFPKQFKYSLDVLCWGTVAKIYSKDGFNCFKTIVKGDIVWIPIYVEHFINQLPTPYLLEFIKYSIPFTITFGKNKLCNAAKSEKCRKFYLFESDIFADNFVEAFTEDPNIDPSISKEDYDLKQLINEIIFRCTNAPREGEIVSYQHKTNNTHGYKISQIIQKITAGQEMHCKEIVIADEQVNKTDNKKEKKKKKHAKTGKKVKHSKDNSKFSLKIPAEVLFTDPLLATFKYTEPNDNFYKTFVLTSCENLLTHQQKLELQPLILKIQKISNLPYELLNESGIKKVAINCTVPGITQFRTTNKKLQGDETLHLYESKFICTDQVPRMKMLELLQSRRVVLEVLGMKQEEQKSEKKQNKKNTKKGYKKGKSKGSSKSIITDTEISTYYPLCIATFDISSLMKTFWIFKEKGQCHNPQAVISQKIWSLDGIIAFNVNEVNLLLDPAKTINSPLTEEKLIALATTLKLESCFLVPQYPSFHIHDITGLFKRLLIMVFDKDIARTITNEITLHNQQFLGKGVLLPNRVKITANAPEYVDQLLSGFMIDDGDNYIFCVEGLANGYILTIIHQVTKLNYPSARVFYDSDNMFEERLYSLLVNYVGFLLVTLKMPLRDIFAEQRVYIDGNVPVPCWKAIQKLNLIVNASSNKSIWLSELLPSETELVSFAIEYGVQLRHKTKQETLEKVVTYSLFNLNESKIFDYNSSFYQ